MNSSKGISLIVLIITIIVLIIISALLINSGSTGLERASEAKIKNEINAIKEAIDKRYKFYLVNEERYPLIGAMIDITEANSVFDRDVTEEIDNIRKLDSTYTKMLSVERVDSNHIYVVNYETLEIIGPIANP
jgi:type II secretory pathway pseudopilin PulG